jgi:hypothetical protein
MSGAERQRRRRARLKPVLKIERLKRQFLDADPSTREEFLYWIRRFVRDK